MTHQIEVAQGAMRISNDPQLELVATLGSCVSVCLFDMCGQWGGMNHIYKNVSTEPLGDAAVIAEAERLVNALMQKGVSRRRLGARITGGAHVLLRGKRHGLAIAEACMGYLTREGIPLLGVSIGGESARRIRFHPVTGRLVVAALAKTRITGAPAPASNGNAPELF
ncbi:putative chemoreceptor glutamine deamidase CheD [Jannaschia pagri]|uniref:Chemoreceptor glutamine deamidase CheD n=1 Tax=Jannaschia pagri TaxID=2829797 RepID=A0ABQ4NN71_9RHOB|nr:MULTISPECIES: chemotaxis protein CheD [unclassified Jannaschia]GIT92029.1 putative chemoreceptor glutamine deamidase CheD [Jannaschia sp. AI_61]GIT95863.1 putative chemoreceptor glutamine deamidase CheD [Jannaschia sp. AI_62]